MDIGTASEQDPDIELRELYNNINRGFFRGQLPKGIRIRIDRRVNGSCIKYKHSEIIAKAFNRIKLLISEEDYVAGRNTLISVIKENCYKLADLTKCEYSKPNQRTPQRKTLQRNSPSMKPVFKDRFCKELDRIVKCDGQCDQCKTKYIDVLTRMTES